MINTKIIADACLFISQFEGFSSKPYLDPIKIPTIGFGTTIYPNNIKVTMKDAPITKDQALIYMQIHLSGVALSVEKMIKNSLNDNQMIAVLSIVYNIGIGNFKKSNLLKNININVKNVVKDNFVSWNKSGGEILAGLTARRIKEWELFSK